MFGNRRIGKVCVAFRGRWWFQKKVRASKEGAGPPLLRVEVDIIPEVEPRSSRTHWRLPRMSRDCITWKATEPQNNTCRERNRMVIDRILTGKARINAYKDRTAETERVKERKRGRVERGAGDVLMEMEPRNRDDEQAVRHADASGCDITENQHEENTMRDIHVGKRGSEAAGEKQLDKLRKTVRGEQAASSASASSDPRLPAPRAKCLWIVFSAARI